MFVRTLRSFTVHLVFKPTGISKNKHGGWIGKCIETVL